MASAHEDQERVHRFRTHWHQHSPPAGKWYLPHITGYLCYALRFVSTSLFLLYLLLMIWVSSTVPGLSNWSSGPPRPHICSFPAQNTPFQVLCVLDTLFLVCLELWMLQEREFVDWLGVLEDHGINHCSTGYIWSILKLTSLRTLKLSCYCFSSAFYSLHRQARKTRHYAAGSAPQVQSP